MTADVGARAGLVEHEGRGRFRCTAVGSPLEVYRDIVDPFCLQGREQWLLPLGMLKEYSEIGHAPRHNHLKRGWLWGSERKARLGRLSPVP